MTGIIWACAATFIAACVPILAKVGTKKTSNLSVLRSGKAKGIRLHTMNRICYFLQCDVGDILKFDGNLDEEEGE